MISFKRLFYFNNRLNQPPLKMKNKIQSLIKIYHVILTSLILMLTIFTSVTLAQSSATVTGAVIDSNSGEPLAGVNIILAGTNTGTSTDVNGTYSLKVPEGEHSISASFVGFKSVTKEITAEPGQFYSVDFELEPGAELGAVQVIGTRNVNRSVAETTVPVDIISLPQTFAASPQTDLNQLLTYVAPSFQANRQSSADATEFVDPASFRGLGPDQILVLINGKRRHNTSLVNNIGTFGNGSVGTDLNAIPYSAIDRIEILRDGAAAQYGSDAVAGVINIVLKTDTEELTGDVTYGSMSRGDGETIQYSANYGFKIGERGFVNMAGEFTDRQRTNRANGNSLIIFDQSELGNFFAYPFTDDPEASRAFDDAELARRGLNRDDFNFRVGDSELQDGGIFINSVIPVSESAEIYSFGGLNFREGVGAPFRRLPSDLSVNVPSIFPVGFQPELLSSINDQSIAFGIRGKIGEWDVDLSNTYGRNRFDFTVDNTVNSSLLGESPTRFEAGGHEFSQNTANLDFTRFFDNTFQGLNIAFGAFYRVDHYEIDAGEEGSFRNFGVVDFVNDDGFIAPVDTLGRPGGSQGFPGFRPENEVNQFRQNTGAYFDLEADFTDRISVAGALRFEDYSDFGRTLNGKIAARFSVTDWLSARGSISNGFRAPALHQLFFNNIATDIVDGRLVNVGTFTNDSNAARALGIDKLDEETSTNFTFGLTSSPTRRLTFTVDGYIINVDDRIVLTGELGADPFGSPVPEIAGILEDVGASRAKFFTNAVDTRTKGLDIITSFNGLKLGSGMANISVSANITDTNIERINIPQNLVGSEDVFFGPKQQTVLEDNIPDHKVIASFDYRINKFSTLLRVTRFGNVARDEFPFGSRQEFDPEHIVDLTVSYRILPQVMITAGGNNIFDNFPEKAIFENTFLGVFDYPPVQQGFNGAYFFGRLTFNL